MTEPEILGPGEFYEEPRRGMGPLAKAFAIGAITVGVVALAGMVWFAYQQGIRSGAEDAAPVIRAAEEPIKREPKDPGGLDVPHQDKLVFGRLAPGQIEQPVERLLPPPEEPAERPQPVVEPETPPAPEPVPEPARAPAAESTPEAAPEPVQRAETQVAATAPTAEPEPTTAPPPPPPSPPAPVVTPPPASKPVAVPAPPAPEAKPEPKAPAPTAAASGGWKIQLAAVSSAERARSEWDRIKSRNSELLGALDLNVQSVQLDRGTFYRIQAGPLGTRAAASDLCAQLKTRSQDCLVVAP